MSYRKLAKNIHERIWSRKDGTTGKALYFKLEIDGRVVHRLACDPENPSHLARNKREAELFLARWRVKLEQDLPETRPKEISFGQFLEDYYLPSAKANLRHFATTVRYQCNVLKRYFEKRPMHLISHFEIEKMLLAERQREGRDGKLSNRTINRLIERLNAIFTVAMAEGLVKIDRNPMRLIRKLEEKEKSKLRLSTAEERKLLEACALLEVDYLASAIIIRLDTGMRPMEFLEMKKEQVHLNQGYVQAISYKTGRRRTSSAQPKGRDIPLTDRAKSEFEKLLERSKDEFVFPYRSVKKSWDSICEAAGIQGFWFRWLRDEAENRWREAGMHPLDIAYLMGHSSPRMTMTYNNPRYDELHRLMTAATQIDERSGDERLNRRKIVAKQNGQPFELPASD